MAIRAAVNAESVSSGSFSAPGGQVMVSSSDIRKYYGEMMLDVSVCNSRGSFSEGDSEVIDMKETAESIVRLPDELKHLYELAWAGVETTAFGLANEGSYSDRSAPEVFYTMEKEEATVDVESTEDVTMSEFSSNFSSMTPGREFHQIAFVRNSESVSIEISEVETASVGVQVDFPSSNRCLSVFRSVIAIAVPLFILYFCI